MGRTKLATAAAAAVLLVAVTGCGSDDEDGAVAVGTEDSPTAGPSPIGGVPPGSAAQAAGTSLTAAVGKSGDPDAFVLTVKDASGADVTTLPAGEYQIQVSDPSTIHNVHITGSGVDKTTSVPETGDVTWSVTLKAGTYTVVCDPHAKMRVEIAVT